MGEMPALKSLVERHQDDPFELIGINEGDSKESFTQGVREHGVNWLVAYQGMGQRSGPITELYRVQAFPTIYVLDADGVIRAMNARGAGLDRIVAELLEELEGGTGEEPPPTDGVEENGPR